jgi:hypothetical protein
MAVLQWMTGETATKHEGGEDALGPRPMKNEGGKWDLDVEKQAARAAAQRGEKKG